MARFTYSELFGSSFSQDANSFTVQKANLVNVGFTPTGHNTAEQLLTALLLRFLTYQEGHLTSESGEPIINELGEPLTFANQKNWSKIQGFYWAYTVAIEKKVPYSMHTLILNLLLPSTVEHLSPELFK
ncbi:hypothetical protein [Leptolyngbya sp. FACHB-261]|uniref:hypothetical protein n=1 Tax=Leptolyngbya sp. FACHB-261 TaxID=2692806 RepID=UPI0016893A8C|nr:hypothetical protein [Leptolyngbya sp. FACHB-261]MBD2100273.1 hypothetical protein [Leptolyngbya sp. FACHB-261]